jgi:hypothetical protein
MRRPACASMTGDHPNAPTPTICAPRSLRTASFATIGGSRKWTGTAVSSTSRSSPGRTRGNEQSIMLGTDLATSTRSCWSRVLIGRHLGADQFPALCVEPVTLRRWQRALIVIAVLALAAAGAYRLAGAEQTPVAEKTPILPPKTSAPVTPAASVAPAKPVVPAAPVAPADRPSKLVTGLRPIRIPPAPQVNPAPP